MSKRVAIEDKNYSTCYLSNTFCRFPDTSFMDFHVETKYGIVAGWWEGSRAQMALIAKGRKHIRMFLGLYTRKAVITAARRFAAEITNA